MLNYLDRKYSSIEGQTFYSAMKRFSMRLLANIILPIYFKCTGSSRIKIIRRLDRQVIVSFTSFPKRISRLWLVIECILRQTYKVDLIVLYLSKQQFTNGEIDLPQSLLKYQKRKVLKIVFVDDDLRSHKKYYYAFKTYPNDIVILIDDDIFYINTMIEDLIKLHEKYPKAICCHRAYRVSRTESSDVDSYSSWMKVKDFEGPSGRLFHTSGGGTLYIPSLISESGGLFDTEIFKQLCFYADDIWLNFHAHLSGILTVKSNYYSDYLPIFTFNDITLKSYNVTQNGNDKQLDNLIKYFNINPQRLFL